MNQALDIMWHLVDDIINRPQHVTIEEDHLNEIAQDLQVWVSDSHQLNLVSGREAFPVGVSTERDLFMYFLTEDAVNFCYWYGSGQCRPGNASSGKLSALLSEVFTKAEKDCPSPQRQWSHYKTIIRQFQDLLVFERFPLLRERLAALDEILNRLHPDALFNAIFCSNTPDWSLDKALDYMLFDLPGYAADMFLKRASLFFQELWKRRYLLSNRFDGAWEVAMRNLPVPIDYHIPNVLRSKGGLVYTKRLAKRVWNEDLIPSGSRMEAEIRASAAYACKWIADAAQVGPAEVDAFLFSQRRRAHDMHPIHLTITTDY